MGSNRRLDGGTSATRFIEDLGKRQRNQSSAEAGDGAGDHLAQRIEMISAFQGHGESAPAEARHDRPALRHYASALPGGPASRTYSVAGVPVSAWGPHGP